MKFKTLMISGALALSVLTAPAAAFAATEDSQSVKIEQKNIHSVLEWLDQNKEALKSQNFQQLDINSLLEQFQAQPGKPAPVVNQPDEQQSEQKADEKAAQPVEQAPAQEAQQPAEAQPQETQQSAEESQQVVTEDKSNEEAVSSDVSAFEQKVVELTNAERAKQGLAPLELDPELSVVAKDKSLDMQNNNYFSHNSPNYGSPFDMMKAYGIDYRTAGENIAMGQTSPEQVVNGWMNSEGHRKNIMNPNFTHIGVGHAENGNYWTQMFIGK
ncbi:hypothetical protein EQV77_09630 [Halobacillus fulvus]|nr:hypothetical protein EQV77_09630 [Halobacillus fulvus]